jgi:ABC-type uncharacterized transport system ATPase subunit
MDEVLAVGDSNFQSKCLEEFNKYKDAGKTVVLVTHDITTVQRYCDRAMLLRTGKVVKIGEAEEVGNAYIYENMSDEENRIREDEKNKLFQDEDKLKKLSGKKLEVEKKRIEMEKARQKEERKNRIAEITRVEFLDKDEKLKNVFMTGDDMSVKVYFKITKTQNVFSFGFGLFNDENVCLLGINSVSDKVDVKKNIENGYVQIDFKNILIKKGNYYIKFSIANSNYTVLYAALHRSQYFKVQSLKKADGLIEMNYQWSKIN